MEILVVVDMQFDFVYGSLGTEQAKSIVPALVKKINDFDGQVIYTLDTHGQNYLQTQEGRSLPVSHCIKGTKGHEIIEELQSTKHFGHALFFEKNTFGSTQLSEYLLQLSKKEKIDKITFVGVCTDICVISNVLMTKAHFTEVPISVDASCCAGVTPQKHESALDVMNSCQIEVIR